MEEIISGTNQAGESVEFACESSQVNPWQPLDIFSCRRTAVSATYYKDLKGLVCFEASNP